MMTLKDRYTSRLTNTLKQRKRIDEAILLRENAAARVLLEAMDQSDLDRATQIIQKMRNVKGKGMQTLDTAIEQAEADLNKFTGGGSLSKAWSAIKQKVGGENPFVKTMAFINAIESGFKQLPQILKNSSDGIDLKAQQDKPLTQIVTDTSKQKVIAQNLVKALTPVGIFGAFKAIPYIDKKQLVVDLLNTPLGKLDAITAAVNQGVKTSDIASELKDAANTDPNATKSQPTEPAKPTSQTAGTEPATGTKASQKSGTKSAAPAESSADRAKKIYKNIELDLAQDGVKSDDAVKIIQTLIDNDLLKA